MRLLQHLIRYSYLLLTTVSTAFSTSITAQVAAFPEAEGFGKFALGARVATNPEVYIVNNLADNGIGSFRDAVSKPGRFVVFAVSGIITLQSPVSVQPNITIAAQTAPGEGIVLYGKRVSFSGANNTICRYLRIRLGAAGNVGQDATGLASGSNMIFDHLSVTWGMDENFSINAGKSGATIDNITIQNSIIGQGLFKQNHSAGGLIQPPTGGKISLIKNLYASNKTRNPKVKGINEFVNNIVYNFGNGGRKDTNYHYNWEADGYIMGGSAGVSEVNIINNYFISGPLTNNNKATPFSRGTATFNVFAKGNFFDNNKNGQLDGAEVAVNSEGYPGIPLEAFKKEAFNYPAAQPILSAQQAYAHVLQHVGANYPKRDDVDSFIINELSSLGTKGLYIFEEKDLLLENGGLGRFLPAKAPLDTDKDGIPDAWEDAMKLNKKDPTDAVKKTLHKDYLNIEVYVNSLPQKKQ